MTDPSAPGGAPPPPNVAALVDAIDARARQAGNDGATAVMQRMLGSVSDVLAAIQDRLDHVEELLASGTPDGGGTGGAGADLVEAVQSGLSAFNARLGRLEEAFVQAVDDSGSGTQAVVEEVREVVTKALEEGAGTAKKPLPLDPETRDALGRVESTLERLTSAREERPAQEVVSLALAGMSERLDTLEHRLVNALQRQQAPVEARPDLSTLDLSAQLAPLHDRLDATESRLTAALDGASRDAVNAAVAPVLDRLDDVERRLGDLPRPASGTTVEDAFELVQVRIAGLEQLVRGRSAGTERGDSVAEVRAALAPVVERMDELGAAQRSASEAQRDGLARVDGAVAAMPGRFTSLEERVWAVVQSLTESGGHGVDGALLGRLEEAVARLERDETSARLVGLVEERMSGGLRAITERTDEVRRGLAALAARPAEDDDAARKLTEMASSVRALQAAAERLPDSVVDGVTGRLAPMSDRLGGLDARLDGIDARVAGIDEAVAGVHEALESFATRGGQREEIAGVVAGLSDLRSAVADRPEAAAMTALTDAVRDLAARPVPATKEDLSALDRALQELAARPVPVTREDLAALERAVQEQAAPPAGVAVDESTAAGPDAIAAITDAVRREAELLTQRVAALAVGVEATRVLVEQHLQDAEGSLGRKAGEVTRRLAADFGIRTKRNGPGGRRDPREIGSG